MASAAREYDPEIKDIADYVANKTIDSELAVSASLFFFLAPLVSQMAGGRAAGIITKLLYPAPGQKTLIPVSLNSLPPLN